MSSAQTKRQKLAVANSAKTASEGAEAKQCEKSMTLTSNDDEPTTTVTSKKEQPNFAGLSGDVDADELTDGTNSDDDDEEDDEDDDDDDEDEDEDEDEEDDDELNGSRGPKMGAIHSDIREQLAAAGPAGVAAAAAIATARNRKRPHTFETNPSVRKRQQTRLIRKLRACIDEYTMRVGQQAVVLITMPGKSAHNFKVFGAQPLESVMRACKQEIMAELEAALLEQAPQQFKADASKHELPPIVIDGIPTPVEKMTQAQLRAFIPLMLKYSTGRGKPGWGKDTTRPPWWPETLPWANVRSDARDESEKQRISWTTTLRQIVTNCYKYHGRDDLLPSFDESEESAARQQELEAGVTRRATESGSGSGQAGGGSGRAGTRAGRQAEQQPVVYAPMTAAYASNFVHTIANADGTVSLIQVDPANAQILTLPDGTQVRAVRLQTLAADSLCGQQVGELQEAIEIQASQAGQAVSVSEASLASDGQIIVTGEDGTQSCYPMSSLVSIPASVYQQFAQSGQQVSLLTADGGVQPLEEQQQSAETATNQQQQQQQGQHSSLVGIGDQSSAVDQKPSLARKLDVQTEQEIGERSNGLSETAAVNAQD